MHPMNRVLAAAALASVIALPSFAATATSLDEAKTLSAETGLPILMKVGTEWCSACKAFDKASTKDAEFVSTLDESVVLIRVDAEKGDGVDVARAHRVSQYPTFILANSDGETIDRWMGFEKAKYFGKTLQGRSRRSDHLRREARALPREPVGNRRDEDRIDPDGRGSLCRGRRVLSPGR